MVNNLPSYSNFKFENLITWGMIPRRVTFFDTKVRITLPKKQILTKYFDPVAQANYEKNWRSTISLDSDFKASDCRSEDLR